MDKESKRTLIIFGLCFVVAGLVIASIQIFDIQDPGKFSDEHGHWLVIIPVGIYLLVCIGIHISRMLKSEDYCPRGVESYVGTGLMLIGWKELSRDEAHKECITTLFITVLFVPILPLRSYKINAPLKWGLWSPLPFTVISRLSIYKPHIVIALIGILALSFTAAYFLMQTPEYT